VEACQKITELEALYKQHVEAAQELMRRRPP
jgi:hypothetical protein